MLQSEGEITFEVWKPTHNCWTDKGNSGSPVIARSPIEQDLCHLCQGMPAGQDQCSPCRVKDVVVAVHASGDNTGRREPYNRPSTVHAWMWRQINVAFRHEECSFVETAIKNKFGADVRISIEAFFLWYLDESRRKFPEYIEDQ